MTLPLPLEAQACTAQEEPWDGARKASVWDKFLGAFGEESSDVDRRVQNQSSLEPQLKSD